jgi:UDP-N-acetylglucosamine 2-epimerase (non-hydrolysing)
MKIMTILGTRPEIIRLSRVIPLLDQLCQHVLVHTGQNFDSRLKDVFFSELGLRSPDYEFDCPLISNMEQIGTILKACEKVISIEQPDRVLILGDTNSALAAIAAKRAGVPVFHMEAGNRCYDDQVPEEVNRRIVDHCSDILLPYTERSRANLLREGIASERIFVIGNPIFEVLQFYSAQIQASPVLQDLQLEPHKYFLVTLHRSENVDNVERLSQLMEVLQLLNLEYEVPVICSLHPRTRSQLLKRGITVAGDGVKMLEPLGLFNFVRLEQQALCVLSDSGTVQEECCIMQIPNVTLRHVTERPETVECGSSILAGWDPGIILQAVDAVINLDSKWAMPFEYLRDSVSTTVAKIIMGKYPE